MQLFGEEPIRVTIDAPDYRRRPPADVFRQATAWLRKYLVAVACGSLREGSYPRIAPLFVQKGDPKFTLTQQMVQRVILEIEEEFRKLRFSGGSDRPDADSIMRTLLDGNGGPRSMGDSMRSLLDLMSRSRQESEDSPFNTDQLAWQEDKDPDSWKGG
jgi:hypothetical protein